MPKVTTHVLDESFNEVGTLSGVTSLSIDRSGAGKMLSASIEVTSRDWDGGWLSFDIDGSSLGTIGPLGFTVTGTTLTRNGRSVSADGVSVLAAADVEVGAGESCPAGSDALEFASGMLSECGLRVVKVGYAHLPSSIVFGSKDTRLSAAWSVLDAVGYRIKLHRDSIELSPLPTDAAFSVSSTDSSGVRDGIKADGKSISWSRTIGVAAEPLDIVNVGFAGLSGAYSISSQGISIGSTVDASEDLEAVVG